MTTIAQLLREKGHAVFSIGPDETVYEALQKMAEANVGCLVVLKDGTLVGIISERDYARNVVLKGRTSPATYVREIMHTAVLYATPDRTVEECMAVMTDKRIRQPFRRRMPGHRKPQQLTPPVADNDQGKQALEPRSRNQT